MLPFSSLIIDSLKAFLKFLLFSCINCSGVPLKAEPSGFFIQVPLALDVCSMVLYSSIKFLLDGISGFHLLQSISDLKLGFAFFATELVVLAAFVAFADLPTIPAPSRLIGSRTASTANAPALFLIPIASEGA